MREIKENKKVLILIIIVILVIIFLIIRNFNTTGQNVGKVRIEHLSKEDYRKVEGILDTNKMVKDLSGGVSIRFFKFRNGKRIWQDEFLIGKNPDVYITLHSKYINNLDNLCQTIREARNAGDLGFYTDKSKAVLLWKFRKMIKYWDCFGL
jgi:uncharacterized membrane protein YvbJ